MYKGHLFLLHKLTMICTSTGKSRLKVGKESFVNFTELFLMLRYYIVRLSDELVRAFKSGHLGAV
jgi:hypothetical protein